MLEITTFTSLNELPEDLVQAASYQRTKDLFQCLEWFSCLYKTALADSATPLINVARSSGGALVGFVALSQPKANHELRSLTNYYTLAFRPILVGQDTSNDAQVEFLESLVAHIANERPIWPYVRLDYLPSNWIGIEQLRTAFRRNHFLPHRSRMHDNWYLPVGDLTFEGYYSSRSSRLRNTIERKEKKVRKAHELSLRILTKDDADLAGAIRDYVSVYNRSWKNPEPHPRFIPEFITLCAKLSILRLGIAYLDGNAVAAQLWITSHGRAIIYKLAYDESVAELSIGAILSRELFRHAIDIDRVSEVDYGIGSEAYKREWMSDVRHVDCIEAYAMKSLSGLLRFSTAAYRGIARKLLPTQK